MDEKNKMGKTVLILGNGFDLAHELPTQYRDFLNYVKRFQESKSRVNSIEGDAESINRMFTYLDNNIWHKYLDGLYSERKSFGENWVDFEHEISHIIQIIDKKHQSLSQKYFEVHRLLNSENANDIRTTGFKKACSECMSAHTMEKISVHKMRELLYNDLNKLICAFEIYLSNSVETTILHKEKISVIEKMRPDYVISFNYTRTYEKLYSNTIPICHIHGVCDLSRSEEKNNMVLGIDNYESKKDHADFSIFKKYVQRILKRNDTSYDKWYREIESEYEHPFGIKNKEEVVDCPEIYSDVYFFGHSLDITDKDIISRFIESGATKVHIYAKDKSSEADLISKRLILGWLFYPIYFIHNYSDAR